jgi:hypothetical protein
MWLNWKCLGYKLLDALRERETKLSQLKVSATFKHSAELKQMLRGCVDSLNMDYKQTIVDGLQEV